MVAAYSKAGAVVDVDWNLVGEDWVEKLRLRPALLRAMGWNYLRAYSFELFSDPDGVAKRVAESIGLVNKTRIQPIFDEPAFEDTDAAWGDRSSSNDAELRNNRPPHWG
jgi:hypothetical protein